ncbi:MAG: hypothetical protein OXU20_17820 [Myxococcales bacterium]|nr:hypothetical protein [Myxococcales bacterium]
MVHGTWRGLGALGLAATLQMWGCARSAGDTPAISNVQWLLACDDDGDCDIDSTCACGVCTLSCENATDCDAITGSECFPLTTLSTCGATAIDSACIATCAEDAQCPSGARCQGARCIRDESLPPDGSRTAVVGAGSWTKLPDPPLSGRTSALVASVGDALLIAGGWAFLCPPGASCVLPSDPPLTDGAAHDLRTGAWRPIADAPSPLMPTATAVVGDDVYVINHCPLSPDTCGDTPTFLRYRSDEDVWDVLPALEDPDGWGYGLLAIEAGVVAYGRSHERGRRPDYVFLIDEQRWTALPEDPLPLTFDRFAAEYDGRLFMFGSTIGASDHTKLAAAYDFRSDTWSLRSGAESGGYQVWGVGDRMYLNGHFGGRPNTVYDPDSDTWSPLGAPPKEDTWWRRGNDVAGILGEETAFYEYEHGWVLDARDGSWLEMEPRWGTPAIPPRPDQNDQPYDTTVGRGPGLRLVLFGGQLWQGGEGRLVADTWLWTPPAK